MNIPQNFEKIQNWAFEIDENNFKIETCNLTNGNFFVFGGGHNKNYCLYFNMYWADKTYVVRKCAAGDGSRGSDISQFNLHTQIIKTPKDFVERMVIQTINWLIENKLY